MLRAAQARADAAGDIDWLVWREHQRLHRVHRGDGGDTGAPHRSGAVPVRPVHVLGDKGYSSKAIRTWLRRRGISHTIPERADQIRNRLRRGSRDGRPPAFDKQLYKRRNVVERRFNLEAMARHRHPHDKTKPSSPTQQPSPSPRS